MVGFWRKMF